MTAAHVRLEPEFYAAERPCEQHWYYGDHENFCTLTQSTGPRGNSRFRQLISFNPGATSLPLAFPITPAARERP